MKNGSSAKPWAGFFIGDYCELDDDTRIGE